MKKTIRIGLASVLAAGLAMGEGAPPGNGEDAGDSAADPASLPASRAPAHRAPDLDFGEDFPAPGGPLPARLPAHPDAGVAKTLPRGAAARAKPSHAWAWWTAGLAALTAGGAAWYLHYGAGSASDPVIRNQEFSDAAD